MPGQNYLTLKLDPAGQVLWTAVYYNPWQGEATPRDLCLDEQGNVYVTGSCYVPGSERDYLTIKYGPNGDELWTARFNSGTNAEPNVSGDEAHAMVVDDAGCVYVCGNRGTIKYDPEGNELWINSSYEVGGGWAIEWSASDGSVLVCGPQSTIKIHNTGTNVWEAPLEKAETLALDGGGGVCATGTRDYDRETSSGDIETIRISRDGQLLWSTVYDSEFHFLDQPGRIAVDSRGCVIVAGSSSRTNSVVATASGAVDIVLLKYQTNGSLAWAIRFNDAVDRLECASALVESTQSS